MKPEEYLKYRYGVPQGDEEVVAFIENSREVTLTGSFEVSDAGQAKALYEAFFEAQPKHLFRLTSDHLASWRFRPLSRLLHLLFGWAGYPKPTFRVEYEPPAMFIHSITAEDGSMSFEASTKPPIGPDPGSQTS